MGMIMSCLSNIIYISEKVVVCGAFVGLISCIILLFVVTLGMGVGLGYNYCYVDLKTRYKYVPAHYVYPGSPRWPYPPGSKPHYFDHDYNKYSTPRRSEGGEGWRRYNENLTENATPRDFLNLASSLAAYPHQPYSSAPSSRYPPALGLLKHNREVNVSSLSPSPPPASPGLDLHYSPEPGRMGPSTLGPFSSNEPGPPRFGPSKPSLIYASEFPRPHYFPEPGPPPRYTPSDLFAPNPAILRPYPLFIVPSPIFSPLNASESAATPHNITSQLSYNLKDSGSPSVEENANYSIKDINQLPKEDDSQYGKYGSKFINHDSLSGKGKSQFKEDDSKSGKGKSQFQEDDSQSGKGRSQFQVEVSQSGKGKSQFLEDVSQSGKGKSQFQEDNSQSGKGKSVYQEDVSQYGKGKNQFQEDDSQSGKGKSQLQVDDSHSGKDKSQFQEHDSQSGKSKSQPQVDDSHSGKGKSQFQEHDSESGKERSQFQEHISQFGKGKSMYLKDDSQSGKDKSLLQKDDKQSEKSKSQFLKGRATKPPKRPDESRKKGPSVPYKEDKDETKDTGNINFDASYDSVTDNEGRRVKKLIIPISGLDLLNVLSKFKGENQNYSLQIITA